MKKILALVLAIFMISCVFTSCTTEDTNHKVDENQSEEEKSEKQTEKPTENSTDASIDNGENNEETNKENNEENNENNEQKPAETYSRDEKKIVFGSYPQSEVKDPSLLATLNAKTGDLPTRENAQAWTSYEYYINGKVENFMWYIDIVNENDKYRGVYFTSFRPQSTESHSENYIQQLYGYDINAVYWFKYEPISWTILSEDSSEGTALILCDMIVDSQAYHISSETRIINGVTVYPSNYAHSTIRTWLNTVFYETAFNDLQKQIILSTTIDNSEISTGYPPNEYACEDTNDKIFLLSTVEANNSDYGLNDTTRQKKATDYAKVQGVAMSYEEDYNGNGWWGLRSPALPRDTIGIYFSGQILGGDVYRTFKGVLPALQIKLI